MYLPIRLDQKLCRQWILSKSPSTSSVLQSRWRSTATWSASILGYKLYPNYYFKTKANGNITEYHSVYTIDFSVILARKYWKVWNGGNSYGGQTNGFTSNVMLCPFATELLLPIHYGDGNILHDTNTARREVVAVYFHRQINALTYII